MSLSLSRAWPNIKCFCDQVLQFYLPGEITKAIMSWKKRVDDNFPNLFPSSFFVCFLAAPLFLRSVPKYFRWCNNQHRSQICLLSPLYNIYFSHISTVFPTYFHFSISCTFLLQVDGKLRRMEMEDKED